MTPEDARIAALETRVAELEAAVAALVPAPPPAPRPASSLPPPVGPPVGVAPGPQPDPPQSASAREPVRLDTEALLKWGGVGLVVLAVAFGVNSAIQRGWIGPTFQLIGAVGLSLALIGYGIRLQPTRRPWTHALCSGGVAGLFITFASDLFLGQVDADIAYALTFVVGLLAIGIARFVASEWVGVTALVGGVIGWLVIADGSAPFIESGAAFVVAVIVVMTVTIERAWFGLRLLTQLVGLACVLIFMATSDTGLEQAATLAAAAVMAAILLSVPSAGELRAPWRFVEVQLPTVLAPWSLLVLAALFADTDPQAGLIGIAVAGFVATYAAAMRGRLLLSHVVSLFVGASVALTIGLGLTLGADTAWVAIAVQGVGLVLLDRVLGESWLVKLNAGGLLVASTAWVVVDGEHAWSVDTSVGADIARALVIVAVGVGAWLSGRRDVRQIGALAVLGLTLHWLGSVLVHLPQGQAIVSLSWAVVGVAVLVAGAVRKMPDLGNVGMVILALTVGKLLFVDMAEVDALWRAGLFLVVGLAYMRLGFVLPRWTESAEPEPASVDA